MLTTCHTGKSRITPPCGQQAQAGCIFSMSCKTAGHLLLCTNEEGSRTSVLCFLPADRCFGLGRCGRQKSRDSGVCVRAVRGGTNESFARCLAASWYTTTTTASACAACFVCKRTRPKTRRSFARSLLAKNSKCRLPFWEKAGNATGKDNQPLLLFLLFSFSFFQFLFSLAFLLLLIIAVVVVVLMVDAVIR